MRITVNSVCHTVLIQIANKKVLCDSTCLIVMTFQCTVIKYRSQIVLPACPGDLPACPPKRTKVKGKCAGVPYIYILQPAFPKDASFGASAYDDFCTLGLVA